MNPTPLISVLMSTFNGSKTIDRAIKSILYQTYSNFELIICNDGSKDNTLKHLHFWANKDSRIKILNNNYNYGLQISLNRCIAYSKSKYIARMDDDDVSLPNRLDVQLHFMKEHPKISFIGSNVYMFDSQDGIYNETKFITYPNKYQLFKRDQFCHPSIFIKSNVLKKVNGYSISKKYLRIEDHELWLRLYSLGYRGANVCKPLLKYHFDIHSNKNKFYDYYNRFRLLLNYRKKLNIGIIGYIYVIIPIIKLIIPSCIRNIIYSCKYKN